VLQHGLQRFKIYIESGEGKPGTQRLEGSLNGHLINIKINIWVAKQASK
jgi:hypothetical protein